MTHTLDSSESDSEGEDKVSSKKMRKTTRHVESSKGMRNRRRGRRRGSADSSAGASERGPAADEDDDEVGAVAAPTPTRSIGGGPTSELRENEVDDLG